MGNTSSTIVVLKTLAKHVAAQLRERAFCIVFEDDLERAWPSKGMALEIRERRIQDFAESQGWSAAIVDSGFGTRAVFHRLKSGADAASERSAFPTTSAENGKSGLTGKGM